MLIHRAGASSFAFCGSGSRLHLSVLAALPWWIVHSAPLRQWRTLNTTDTATNSFVHCSSSEALTSVLPALRVFSRCLRHRHLSISLLTFLSTTMVGSLSPSLKWPPFLKRTFFFLGFENASNTFSTHLNLHRGIRRRLTRHLRTNSRLIYLYW